MPETLPSPNMLPPPWAILVVDDEQLVRDVLSHTLSADFDVTTAESGTAALDMLHQRRYDMLITDLMMPFVDGVAVARAAKEINRAIDVLIVTGYPSADNERRCREVGCVDIVMKPFNVAAIRATVRACAHRRDTPAGPSPL